MEQVLAVLTASQSALGADQTLLLGEVVDGGTLTDVTITLPPGATTLVGVYDASETPDDGFSLTLRRLSGGSVVDDDLATLVVDHTVSLVAEEPFVWVLGADERDATTGDAERSEIAAGDSLDVVVHQLGDSGLAIPAGAKIQAHLL